MPKIALSDVGLRSLKPPAHGTRDYWDKSLPSFGVRVSQGGTKTFVLNLDKARRKIGRFPVLSLADARDEARRIMAERTLGRVRPQSISFQTALTIFLDEKRKSRRARTAHDLDVRLTRHFPFKCQLGEITHSEVARRLAKIRTNSEHDHALAVAKTFFTWAHNRRYIDDNPTRGIAMRGSQSRTRVLSDDELKCIWRACEANRGKALVGEQRKPLLGDPPPLPLAFSTIVELLILTGQRRGEITTLQPSWLAVENKTLTIPASVAKNGREHTLPLGALSAELLMPLMTKQTCASGYIFSARTPTSKPFNGWSKSKAALDAHAGVTNWVLHDIRRTVATRLAEMGVLPHVIEAILNHKTGTLSPIAQVYNRHNWLKEMRCALDMWEQHLVQHVI